jgi:hypothetical protein
VILSGGLAWEAHLGGWIAVWAVEQAFARRSREQAASCQPRA